MLRIILYERQAAIGRCCVSFDRSCKKFMQRLYVVRSHSNVLEWLLKTSLHPPKPPLPPTNEKFQPIRLRVHGWCFLKLLGLPPS